MKKLLSLGILLLLVTQLFALSKPDLRCLEVDDQGHITVHWIAPTDMTGFSRYEVWHATIGGNFSRRAVIMNGATSTFYDTAASALTQSSSYFVVAFSAASEYHSDTISTIELYLTNGGTGTAQLVWTPPASPFKPSYFPMYDVWKEYPAETWTYLSSTQNTSMKDTNEFCEATVGYRVELFDASGCRNVSRPERDLFHDLIPPKKPRFDSVSVDVATNALVLGWQPSVSSDVNSYIVYYFENNVWIPVDTVYGYSTTVWTTVKYNPEQAARHFRIAAMDDCLNVSPLTDEQFNIQSDAQFDYCLKTAFITWTTYGNMPQGVQKYQIFYSVNNGPYQLAGEADGSEQSFSFPGLIANSDYSFFVRAVNTFGNITASSTKSHFNFSPTDNKDFIYIRSVSVVDNDHLEIKVSTGSTISFTGVSLYRSVDSGATFSFVNKLKNNGTDTYVFKDENINVSRNVYYYKAFLESACGLTTLESNVSHNILLKGSSHNYNNTMSWNEYSYWENGTDRYEIERRDYLHTTFQPVGVGYDSYTLFSDDVSGMPEAGDQFFYRVKAYNAKNQYGFDDVSYSNQIVAYQEPIVYIANAFRPQAGVVTIFKPYTSFVNLTDYSFYIYSREGMLLFETHNPEEGWNGKVDEKTFYGGSIFVYKIKFSYGKDDLYEKVGTVTVLR